MFRRSPSLLAGSVLALVLAGALAGCAGGSGSTPDLGVDGSDDLELDAAWLDGGRMIGLVTEGSSGCVPAAGDVSLLNGVLQVQFVDVDADTACTMDFVPRVTLVSVPEGVDPAQGLEIRVTGDGYAGDTDLDGIADLPPVTEFTPSAAWTGDDGQFVFVTWGSSGCPPVVSDAAATGPAEVTVTFADPPADQVCTADMGPRGGVASVSGIDSDAGGVELVLVGDAFDGVRVPILGSV